MGMYSERPDGPGMLLWAVIAVAAIIVGILLSVIL